MGKEKFRAVFGGILSQPQCVLEWAENAGGSGIEGKLPFDRRGQLPDPFPAGHLKTGSAVLFSARLEGQQTVVIVGGKTDNQFTGTLVGDVQFGCGPVKGAVSLDAKARPFTARLVVEAGVQHPGIAGARPAEKTRTAFKHTDFQPVSGKFPRDRTADYPCADDDEIKAAIHLRFNPFKKIIQFTEFIIISFL